MLTIGEVAVDLVVRYHLRLDRQLVEEPDTFVADIALADHQHPSLVVVHKAGPPLADHKLEPSLAEHLDS